MWNGRRANRDPSDPVPDQHNMAKETSRSKKAAAPTTARTLAVMGSALTAEMGGKVSAAQLEPLIRTILELGDERMDKLMDELAEKFAEQLVDKLKGKVAVIDLR